MEENKNPKLTHEQIDIIEMASERFLGEDGKPLMLASYQAEIISYMLRRTPKLLICAATRSGKTEAVSAGAFLMALSNDYEKILIVAPTYEHGKILMRRIASHISENPDAKCMIDTKKEFTRYEVNFENGSSIKILSAKDVKNLLGHGATVVIVDEAAIIEDDVFNTGVRRMLVNNLKNSPVMILLSTPHKRNFFFDAYKDPSFTKITVNWKMAVAEGRMSKEKVLEEKSKKSDNEFKIWYEAEFPEEDEEAIYNLSCIETAFTNSIPTEAVNSKHWYEIGVDVGLKHDYTVITTIKMFENTEFVEMTGIISKTDTNDMEIVGMIVNKINELGASNVKWVKIDEIGVGRGVVDRLKELGYNVAGFNGSAKPRKEKFLNMKAEAVWNVKWYLQEKKIKMLKNENLVEEMLKMRYTPTSAGKIRIADSPGKSPDFHDSLVIALWKPNVEQFLPMNPKLVEELNNGPWNPKRPDMDDFVPNIDFGFGTPFW